MEPTANLEANASLASQEIPYTLKIKQISLQCSQQHENPRYTQPEKSYVILFFKIHFNIILLAMTYFCVSTATMFKRRHHSIT
jgi:hypothetical protein